MIQARAQFKRRSTANNVEILVPVPEDADSPRFRTNIGSVHYAPEKSAIIWKIKQFGGGKEFLMRAELGLPSVKGDDEHGGGMTGGFGGSMGGAGQGGKGKRPISVKFEIPYFTTSGIQVRYLKIIEPKVSAVDSLLPLLHLGLSILAVLSLFRSHNPCLARHFLLLILVLVIDRGHWPLSSKQSDLLVPGTSQPQWVRNGAMGRRSSRALSGSFHLPLLANARCTCSFNTLRFRGSVTSRNPGTLRCDYRMSSERRSACILGAVGLHVAGWFLHSSSNN